MAMITSGSNSAWPLDCAINDLPAAGLPAASKVRFKLFTLDHRLVRGQLGTLSNADQAVVREGIAMLEALLESRDDDSYRRWRTPGSLAASVDQAKSGRCNRLFPGFHRFPDAITYLKKGQAMKHLDIFLTERCGLAAVAAVCLAASPCALSQSYPSKPLRMVITTGAGGPMDTISRGVARVLGESIGQSVVVENRPGADGIIATEACAKAAPDGHTVCVLDNFTLSLNPLTHRNLPYDPIRDLVPVIHYGYLAVAIVARPDLPANSMKQVFDYVRANPGKVSWGSWGRSSATHLYMEYFKSTRGLQFLNVPYKAGAMVYPAMLAGEIDLGYLAVGPAAKAVQAGKAKALAVTGPTQRSPFLPDVPTYLEAGLDISLGTWLGMFAPSGVSPAIIRRLNAILARDLFENAAQRERYLSSMGIAVEGAAGGSPEAFASLIVAEREKLTKLATLIGLKPQ